MREFRFIVTKEDESLSIRRMLRRHFRFSSRLFSRLKADRLVFLNGEVLQGYMHPRAGDEIRAVMPEETSYFTPEDNIPIEPVYEDEDLLLLNKPAGFTVHPTNGHTEHTIANGIMQYMADTGQSFKIRFANRLDMDTTGLLIIAKHSHSQDDIVQQMHDGTLEKQYRTLVVGEIEEDAFTIDLPIAHDDPGKVRRIVVPEGQGRRCITHVRVLERLPGYTYCAIRLETGRTHQIRVHMSHIGHPVAGDPLYGTPEPELIPHQALHAFELKFRHPVTGEAMDVTAPLPPEFRTALDSLREKAE